MKFFGKYEVGDQIGNSLAGTKYRARDPFRKRDLALKILHPVPTLEPAAKDVFCREFLTNSELVHRHLAKVLDIGEVEGSIYIATELLNGSDLRSASIESRNFTIAQKIGILAQTCEGLAFAHSRETVHGSIKPSNIFVDNNIDVTILDLGTAKWQSFALSAGSRQEELQPNYFAPEQILGQKSDARSDLFSLALLAYELLVSRYPFQVPASLIPREIVHSDPEPLRKQNPEIPEELENLINRGLKKNPEERLRTAEEFAAGLYSIAQYLRRSPVQVVSAQPEAPAIANVPEPAPATPEPLAAKPVETESKTPKRQDVQTAAAEQPWTARSYASGAISRSEDRVPQPKELSVHSEAPKPATQPDLLQSPPNQPPANQPPVSQPIVNAATDPIAPRPEQSTHRTNATSPPANIPAMPSSVPARPTTRPASRIQRKPGAAQPLKKQIAAVALGAVLAIYGVVSYVSHQGLRASEKQIEGSKPSVRTKPPITSGPSAERAAVAVEPAPAPVEDAPAAAHELNPEPKPEPKPEQILRKQVKTFWESGNYSEAMRLVDEVLTVNPASAEARSWKKKIRAAQEAEAAIK